MSRVQQLLNEAERPQTIHDLSAEIAAAARALTLVLHLPTRLPARPVSGRPHLDAAEGVGGTGEFLV